MKAAKRKLKSSLDFQQEEVGNYDPEKQRSTAGDNCSEIGSYAESMTNRGVESGTSADGDYPPARPRLGTDPCFFLRFGDRLL